jgi:LuxR family maltose regulon positive regulatory protein
MLPPLLVTKLFVPPPRPGVVLRPNLIKRLNEGLSVGRKLTLISAPAGFGKTTLISEWVATCGRPVAWLSLDAGDNDPACFLTYLIAALQTIAPKIGEGVLGALSATQNQPPPIESLLTTLINELTSISEDIILVLDDYHVIEAQPLNQALTFLVEHLPPQLHLVIATREDPPLPLARWRVRGQLTELRAADLRFTTAEAAEFLNQVMVLNLSAEDIVALENRTEGWIAGLQLAAISMQGNKDTENFIRSFTGSHHFVLDYLLEEVLQHQSKSVQTFLLNTSILDRLYGPLCDAVMGYPSASGQETLEYLERANLFIVPLDDARCWYRYHHLFADLLLQRLHRSTNSSIPEKEKGVAELHQRASQWFEKNGDKFNAFQHAIAAMDRSRAAGLAEMTWKEMDGTFQSAAWLGWTKKLPEEIIRVRPVLCAQIAQSLADNGDAEASESRLHDAERWLKGSSDGSVIVDEEQFRALPSMIALARAYNAQALGRLDDARKYAELALQLIPEEDFFRRAQATITLEITHWTSGDLESARRAMGDWMKNMEQTGNFKFVIVSAFAVADMLLGLGRLAEAERVYQDALHLVAQHALEAEHITAHHHLGLSSIYHQWGDDTLADHHLKRAAELGPQTTLVEWPHRWHVAQAQMKEAAGDLETALAILDEAKRVYIQSALPDLRPIAALKARIYLKQGRPDKARAWAAERRLSMADEVSYLHEFEYLTLARLEIANPLVNALLVRLLQAAETQKRQGSALDILLVQALAHEAQGNRLQALAAFKQALSVAEPEHYISIFVDEGEPMRKLIADFRLSIERQMSKSAPTQLAYTDKLLAAFILPATALKSAALHHKTDLIGKSGMIEPLSEREMDVLKLLRSELSGPEIAQQLIVSPNTLHTHTKSIYNKLGVNNRRAAVRRAEELDLI